MSRNSSVKKPRLRDRLKRLAIVTILPLWAVVAVFVIGQAIVTALFFGSLPQLNIDQSSVDATITMMVLSVLIYIIGLAVLLIEPFALRNMTWSQIRFARRGEARQSA